MTILDKLLEKKDLLIYIDTRIRHLEHIIDPDNIHGIPERKREITLSRLSGRIRELRRLKQHIASDSLKDYCKRHW